MMRCGAALSRAHQGPFVGYRQCTICLAESRAQAELLLASGAGFAATARKLGLSADALERHWKRHVPTELRVAMQPSAKALAARAELAGQVADESTSTLEHLKAARALLWQMLVDEREAGNTALAVMAATQYGKICNSIAKITGELAQSPLVSHTTLNFHFTQDPEFQQLLGDLADALAPYPQARRAVFDRFAALDADPIEVPALEQQQNAQP